MRIILARHGNTFEPNTPVVWAGSKNDLALAKKGVLQAYLVSGHLQKIRMIPAAIYCGPLQRTKNFATLIAESLRLPFKPTIDQRLNEIDYGYWTGLTHQQVAERYGNEEQDAWDQRSQWPQNAGWPQTENQIIQEVKSLFEDLANRHPSNQENVLLVSSSGRLRYFLTLIEGEFQRRVNRGDFKFKTGSLGIIEYENKKLNLSCWNVEPD